MEHVRGAKVVVTVFFLGFMFLLWASLLLQALDSEYRSFARGIGMRTQDLCLLDAGEFLERQIPAGTPLPVVRKRFPRRYLVEDESVYSYAIYPADWIIRLGDKGQGGESSHIYAELYFVRGANGEETFRRSDAAIYPFRYPRFVLTPVLIAVYLLAWLLLVRAERRIVAIR